MSGILCDDWRHAPADLIGGLLEAERHRWIEALHWDMVGTFRALEANRANGQAPGLIAHDAAGRVVGWTYYMLHNRRLQIGGLVAESGEVTRQLLDGALRGPEAEMAGEVLCFAFPASASLEGALTRRRFALMRYLYLRRTLSPNSAGAAAVSGSEQLRSWVEEDGVETVRLMARAYTGVAAARSFAPNGQLEEWAYYLAQLIKTPACGTFLPQVSLSVQHAADDHLRGVLLATTLQRDTAHIAQLAIDPAYRRRGVGRRLLGEALQRAAAAGYWRTTLLVAEDNAPARELYASLGFEPHGHFVCATRSAPNRLRGQRSGHARAA